MEFEGEFFHQHFGDDEVIRGYKGLAVTLWVSAATAHVWLEIQFAQKKLGADKLVKVGSVVMSRGLHVGTRYGKRSSKLFALVLQVFNEHFPKDLLRSKQDFIAAVTGAAPALQSALLTAGNVVATLTPSPQPSPTTHIRHLTLATAPPEVQVRCIAVVCSMLRCCQLCSGVGQHQVHNTHAPRSCTPALSRCCCSSLMACR
jgi:hypothetical protein